MPTIAERIAARIAREELLDAAVAYAKVAGCEKLPPALREQCEKKQNGGKSDDKKDDKDKGDDKSEAKGDDKGKDDKGDDKKDKKLPPWLKDKKKEASELVAATQAYEEAIGVRREAKNLADLPGFEALKGLSRSEQQELLYKAMAENERELRKIKKDVAEAAKGLHKKIREGQ